MLRRSFAAAIVLVATGFAARAAEIALACSALGKEYEICKQGAEAWAKKTGNTVKIVSTPNSATERLALYQQLLAAGAGDIDVFQIDVVWPGILGNHFVDLDPEGARVPTKEHFPAMVENNTRRRQARRDALVRRCRPALLPQGPAREIQAPRAADLAGPHRDRAHRSRTASARPATTTSGASSSRAGPMRA